MRALKGAEAENLQSIWSKRNELEKVSEWERALGISGTERMSCVSCERREIRVVGNGQVTQQLWKGVGWKVLLFQDVQLIFFSSKISILF